MSLAVGANGRALSALGATDVAEGLVGAIFMDEKPVFEM